MTIKTYEAANTIISNMCIFIDGKPRKINFSPISVFEGSHTGYGSMYATADKKIQEAIEGSRMYGRQIKLWKEEMIADEPVVTIIEPTEEEEETYTETPNNADMTHVGAEEVSSMNDAREYLENHFGIERKKVSNPKALLRVAAEYGIVFDGI